MIKKYFSLLLITVSSTVFMYAQGSNKDGFPWSTQNAGTIPASELVFPATDNSEGLKQLEKPGPYYVAKTFPVDIRFPESGVLTKLENGGYIWKVSVKIDEAKGIGTYFDDFSLPQGVSFFITNQNGKHIMGPYTIMDNDESGRFATSAIQGDIANIELNIESQVELDQIKFHIYKLASYFRGVSELEYYSDSYAHGTIDWYDDASYGYSSACMINANCPQAAGFDHAKNATVKEIIPSGGEDGLIGYCSGTLVAPTGVSPSSCQRYLLTATHCEGSNATGTSPIFSEWINKFNYQTPECENPLVAPVSDELRGVKFLARDPYDDDASASELDADFLLFQLTKPAPSAISSTAILAGWDRNPDHTKAYVSPRKFVFFHHPAGDVKKFSSSKTISDMDASTWGVEFTEGYGAPGSSGSGMFDYDQRVMGIASTAIYGAAPVECLVAANGEGAPNTSTMVFYAKVAYSWENPSLSSPTDAQKLKPWLDPENTGVMSTNAYDWNCNPVGLGVSDLESSFDGDFTIYPNPSTDGNFQMNIRMNQTSYAQVQVYDVTGKAILSRDLGKLQSQIVNLDLSQLTSGMYMVRISNQYGQITRKVVINK